MNQNKLLELGCSETEFNFSKLITMEMLFIFLNMCMCVKSVLFTVNAYEDANKAKLIGKMCTIFL